MDLKIKFLRIERGGEFNLMNSIVIVKIMGSRDNFLFLEPLRRME
jgi:hypothetical protein